MSMPYRLKVLAIKSALRHSRFSAYDRRRVIDYLKITGLNFDPEIRKAVKETGRGRLLRIWASKM